MTAQNAASATAQASDLVVRLVEGSWLSRALHLVVSLRIPDLLRDGARPIEELAAETHTHAQSLHRVVRALAGEGIFGVDESGRCSLTAAGTVLRSDVPNSLYHWVLLMLGTVHQEAWGDLMHAVRSGGSAFQHRFGVDLWQFCSEHPDHAQLFAAAMAGFTTTYIEDVLSSYPFAGARTIVDVGGGEGNLLLGILETNQGIQGIVFDLPQVLDRARQRIREMGLTGRCIVCAGDALVEVPPGGDIYILSRVIHDWDDDGAHRILLNCRQALAPGGRILVIERALPDGGREGVSIPAALLSHTNLTDLNMMVMTTGRERSMAEYQRLFLQAGLDLVHVVPTRTAMTIMEVVTRQITPG